MAKPGNTGLRRIIRATRYSAQGLGLAWRHESAFRQELMLAAIMVPSALWLGETVVERLLLIGCCFIVLIVELLNSAVEAAIDRIGNDHHELSQRAKDTASAAVFLSLILTVVVWASIAWQRFS